MKPNLIACGRFLQGFDITRRDPPSDVLFAQGVGGHLSCSLCLLVERNSKLTLGSLQVCSGLQWARGVNE